MTASYNPQGPLSVGNAVSAGLQIYRNHFKQYFSVAVQATLWVILPLAGLFVAAVGLALLQIDNPGPIVLLVVVGIVALIYCIGKYMSLSAAIARLAFGELTGQPEPTRQAKRFTNSRLWGFWGVTLLLGLLYMGLFIGFYIVISVVAFAAAAVFSSIGLFTNFSDSPVSIGLVILLTMLLMIGLLVPILWFTARFSIAEIPLAIEQEIGATESIGRSWQLTKKNVWRVLLVLFVATLITLPLIILVQVFTNIAQVALIAVIPDASALFGIVLLASYIIGLLANVITLPLWQTIKAVIYYDLRSRREGLGLELPNRGGIE